MMKSFLTINIISEIICFLVALVCLLKVKSPVWKYFSFYLLITCLTEITGVYLREQHVANQWPYNIFILFEIGFTGLVFGQLLKRNRNGRILILTGMFVLALFYLYETISHSLLRFHSLTNNAESVIFVIYSFYYFYLLLKDEEYINLKFFADFWWVVGVLFFYFGSTAVNLYRGMDVTEVKTAKVNPRPDSSRHAGMVNNMREPLKMEATLKSLKQQGQAGLIKRNKPTAKQILTSYIMNLLIILLYGCWSYSFICRKWLTTKSGI